MNKATASAELCARCWTIDLDNFLLSEARPSTIALGYFQDIIKNEHCSLCKLVIQTLSFSADRHWEPGKYPHEMCYLGRHGEDKILQVWFDSTTETLPDGVYGHSTTLGKIQLLECTPHDSDASRSYKPVARLVGDRIDLSVVESWLENCKDHPKCNALSLGFFDIDETLPLLLIDVKRMRLAACDWGSSRYVALSYVWGRVKQYQTLRSNFKHLSRDGSLLKIRGELPRVINDAIDLVTTLGESYLWVDTLCIVQDDVDSKDKYISRMNRVYGQALLTIIALSGQDANTPLPGLATGSRKAPHIPVQIGRFKLLAGLPNLSSAQQGSTWMSRGWTFQEELLSKRRLYFWDHQVYWQCASTYCAENIIGEIKEGRMALGSFYLRQQDASADLRSQFFHYQSLGKMYSRRQLTYPSDTLKAFGGVLAAIKMSFGWEFASALPEAVFDLALLWRPIGHSRTKLNGLQPPTATYEPADCYLPTWCWTAWTGFIHWDAWRLDAYVGKTVTLNPEVMDYFIKGESGLRRIVRAQGFDQNREGGYGTSLQLTDSMEELLRYQGLPLDTLMFEATSLSIDGYTLSKPLPESFQVLPRLVSHQFKNDVRQQLWIYDGSGHHCGMIEGMRSWDPSANVSYDLVLLSSCDQDEVTQADIDRYRDYLPLEYLSAEEHYEEVFDTKYFKYKRSWTLNIILIQWKGESAERVGVGQMHVDAWNRARQQKKIIVLR